MFALLPGTQYLVPERRWVEEIIMMTSDLSVCAFTWYSVLGSRAALVEEIIMMTFDLSVCAFTWYSVLGSRAALGGRNNYDDL